MSHYKDLNKELVEQVQSMKVLLNDYQTEIISLKAQMREQYENNLFLKKKCYYMAIRNCRELVEILEPECSLLYNLRQYDEKPQDEQQLTNANGRRTGRITEISEEIRRSNNIIHSRQSLNSLSPLRSRSTDDESDTDTVVEMENTPAPTETPKTKDIIYEEDEFDTEIVEELQNTVADDETRTETMDRLQNTVHEVESHIETVDELEISDTNKEMNTITTITTDEDEPGEDIITQHMNKLKYMSLDEKAESPIQVRELRGNRCYANNRSIPLPPISTGEEDSMHFSKVIASSTPNSRNNSRQELVLRENIVNSPAQSKSLPTTSTRPSRSCKPNSFKELKINAKQRNNSKEKSLACGKRSKKHK